MGVLSGGEKARIMFLIIKLNQPNFLILDEPTNHIDIQGKEELEEQILESNATVLITSHDRRFVDNIAEHFVLISDGQLKGINHADQFYRSSPTEGKSRKQQDNTPDQAQLDDEEQILARIVELESLLEADLARKPRLRKAEVTGSLAERTGSVKQQDLTPPHSTQPVRPTISSKVASQEVKMAVVKEHP